tara:strand:+ start:562 stop:846 length:285 start_codon:yes stop_codon:yes gene_type:complete
MDRFGWDEATEWDYNQEAYGPSALDPVYESASFCPHCGYSPDLDKDKAKRLEDCCEEAAKEFSLYAIRDMDNLETYCNLIPHPMAWSWNYDCPF